MLRKQRNSVRRPKAVEEGKPASPSSENVVLDSPEQWDFSVGYGQVRWGETWGRVI